MSDNHLRAELTEFPEEAVLLDETSYSTNIHEYIKELVRQGVDSKEWKFWIIQWVAESLTPAVRSSDKCRCSHDRVVLYKKAETAA